jgi:poly(3-hydroxybutyrate) depolymerase
VVAATEALRDDPGLGIDPAQIYVAGLSSGAGEALVLGCVAPDLFAGVVASAGPAVGTTSTQAAMVGTTAAQAQTVCETLAGPHAASFDTQLGIAFTDTADYIVAQGYAQLDAEVFDLLFSGGAMQTAPVDVTALEGSSPTGDARTYADGTGPRALWISSTSGTGHAWPAGSGEAAAGLSFVSGAGINLSYVAAKFFADNSRRTVGGPPPGSDDSGGGSGDGNDSADGTAGDEEPTPTSGADDSTAGTDPAAADGSEASGCQCTTTPSGLVPGAWLIALLGLTRRRRRGD